MKSYEGHTLLVIYLRITYNRFVYKLIKTEIQIQTDFIFKQIQMSSKAG